MCLVTSSFQIHVEWNMSSILFQWDPTCLCKGSIKTRWHIYASSCHKNWVCEGKKGEKLNESKFSSLYNEKWQGKKE